MSAKLSKMKIKVMKCVAFINFYLYVQNRSSRENLWGDMAFIRRKWILFAIFLQSHLQSGLNALHASPQTTVNIHHID